MKASLCASVLGFLFLAACLPDANAAGVQSSAITITAQPSATPNPGIVGQAVKFSVGATSTFGDTLTYTWSFNDGGPDAAGNPVSRTFAVAAYGYSARVTVTDNHGNSNYYDLSFNVFVTPPPVITAQPTAGPNPATVRQVVNFTVSAQPGTAGDTLTYDWHFGDNTYGTGNAPSHAYAAPGTYFAFVYVKDNHGNSIS